MEADTPHRAGLPMRPGALLAWLASGLAALGASEPTKPNILFLITDQHMADALSCAGNAHVKTPNLDKLAARGVRFTRNYVANPLCVPSRASLFSSRMPHELGIYGNTLGTDLAEKSVPTLGELMRQGGYDTFYAGKWHVHEAFPAYAASARRRTIPGFELLPMEGGKDPRAGDKKTEQKSPQCDPHVAAAAVKFLETKHARPFLLTVSLLNPHDICEFPYFEGFKAMLPADDGALPPLRPNAQDATTVPSVLRSEKENRGAWAYGRWTEQQWRQYQWVYYRLVESSDRLLGQVLDALERSEFKDNTLVVFTSDHGEMLGAHRLVSKEKLYEEAAKVPLIVALPGRPAGVNTRSLTCGMDLMPTFLDFADVPRPAELRGRSLRPLLEGKPDREPEFVAAESFDPEARMIRTSRYKYVKYTFGENSEQFFDLEQDPYERRNLIAQAELATEIQRHRALLNKWMADTKDEFRKGTEILAGLKAREGADEDGKAKAKKK